MNHNQPTNSRTGTWGHAFIYFVIGVYFGIVLVKGEAVSWFRMQEMFRMQGARIYLLFASAVITAALGLAMIRRTGVRTLAGDPIVIQRKELGTGRRFVFGSMMFGAGWAVTGACPGPMFALLGTGTSVMSVVLLGAIGGTWTYGLVRDRMPH